MKSDQCGQIDSPETQLLSDLTLVSEFEEQVSSCFVLLSKYNCTLFLTAAHCGLNDLNNIRSDNNSHAKETLGCEDILQDVGVDQET